MTSQFWVALCSVLDKKQAMSRTFHPQTDGKVQSPPPPILEDDELSFDVERVLTHEGRGSRTRPQKFHLIKWLGYGTYIYIYMDLVARKEFDFRSAQRILGHHGTFTRTANTKQS